MTYVWTPEQIKRYRGYYRDVKTHHSYAYATFATTADFALSVLPPCLEPADEPAVTISFGAFMEWHKETGVPNRDGRDRAALIGINAQYGESEGTYYLTVIETDEVMIITGREFWGMPKKQGSVDCFEDGEEFFGVAERRRHRLIEMQGQLGEAEDDVGDQVEIYLELSGSFGPTADELSGVKLAVFENTSVIKRMQLLTDVEVVLRGSPWDPGIGTIPLGDQIDGGCFGGETAYSVREVVDLAGDGNDYTPYLLGRLYDDFPDVREVSDRGVGRPRRSGVSAGRAR